MIFDKPVLSASKFPLRMKRNAFLTWEPTLMQIEMNQMISIATRTLIISHTHISDITSSIWYEYESYDMLPYVMICRCVTIVDTMDSCLTLSPIFKCDIWKSKLFKTLCLKSCKTMPRLHLVRGGAFKRLHVQSNQPKRLHASTYNALHV